MFPKERFEILKRKLGLDLPPGTHRIVVTCELCGRELFAEVYRTGSGEVLRSSFELHHKDGDRENNSPDNIMILCEDCHRKLHLWGEIQRWLDRIGKTVDDLPDCRNLKPLARRYGWS